MSADSRGATADGPSAVADLLGMTKPKIGLMVLVAVAVGYLAAPVETDVADLVAVLVGVLFVGSASSVLNQVLEVEPDGRMERTCERPLPAGRLRVRDALVFGLALAVVGLAVLLSFTPALTALLCAGTLVAYLLAYTPLKRFTPHNTIVGAVPGAMPPLLGWTAATGRLDLEALALFAILFVWQLPHFLSIAWLYREDYASGGFRMISQGDHDGARTARHMMVHGALLGVVSFGPLALGMVGPLYVVGAVLVAAVFLWAIFRFQRRRDDASARSVLTSSLLYLPVVLGLAAIGS